MPRTLALILAAAILMTVSHAHDASRDMTDAANAWLGSLSDSQRASAGFDLTDEERENWHFIPRDRNGLSIKEMSPEQRTLAHALLAVSLSETGYSKAANIISLEKVLAVIENRPEHRDPEKYYFSIFGEPTADKPWGWRFEGHHLSFNFTIPGGETAPSVTPSFMGSNPAIVMDGPRKGVRVLENEEELARSLVKSLSAAQLKTALIMEKAPNDVFNVPGRNETKPAGIPWSDLDTSQQQGLLEIVREYLYRYRTDIAGSEMKRLEDRGLENLYFAWAGQLEKGEPHYYRIQGGNFVLEYDNTQDGANHAHSLWRDFDRDFGLDELAQHYRQHAH